MKKKVIINLSASFLILLFCITALEKILWFNNFRDNLSAQVFGQTVSLVLAYTIPFFEVLCAIMLLFRRTRYYGFLFSVALMGVFTAYVVLVLLQFFSKHPCPCGGAISNLTWGQHLSFNLFFLVISTLGLVLIQKERRLKA